MSDLIFNSSTDNYIYTGSRLRAPPQTTLRLSTAENEAYIDLSSNSIVDISASSVNINTSNFSITGGGGFNVGGGLLTIESGLQIGSGLYGGKIYKSTNPYEIVIDPFGLDPSTNILDASGQVTIMGDLFVQGNTTTIRSSYIDTSAVKLTLASGVITDNIDGAGIELGKDGYASMLWNTTAYSWIFNKTITINPNLDNSNSLILGSGIVTSNNNAKITNTFSAFTVLKEGLLSNVGTSYRNIWTDASGWTLLHPLSSQYSYTKIEARIAYTSSSEAEHTLSFKMLKYSPLTSSYSIELFTDLSLGSNMGVSINNVHSILYYDTTTNTVPSVEYKLQFMRNCPTNSTISISFGIQESSGNFISVQELYRPLA
jgi:hypothetical protein